MIESDGVVGMRRAAGVVEAVLNKAIDLGNKRVCLEEILNGGVPAGMSIRSKSEEKHEGGMIESDGLLAIRKAAAKVTDLSNTKGRIGDILNTLVPIGMSVHSGIDAGYMAGELEIASEYYSENIGRDGVLEGIVEKGKTEKALKYLREWIKRAPALFGVASIYAVEGIQRIQEMGLQNAGLWKALPVGMELPVIYLLTGYTLQKWNEAGKKALEGKEGSTLGIQRGGDHMDRQKVFYKSESASRQAEKRSGCVNVPVTIFLGGETVSAGLKAVGSSYFVEKKFMESLFKSPRRIVAEKIGDTTVRLVYPSTWSSMPLVAIEKKGCTPDYRIHSSSPNVSGHEMARLDFTQVVADLRKDQGLDLKEREGIEKRFDVGNKEKGANRKKLR